MIKTIIFATCMLLVGGLTLEPEAQAGDGCHAGWGRHAVKVEGLAAYPQHCQTHACHVASHVAIRADFGGWPPSTLVYFKYRMAASGEAGLPWCPSDVESAQWGPQ